MADTTEYDLMVEGLPYLASDPYISQVRARGSAQLRAINAEYDDGKRTELLRKFFNCAADAEIYVVLPFFCEYGFHINLGNDIIFNTGCTILDVCSVTIGSRTMFGPNVQIYTATHPLRPEDRCGTKGRESARPIVIGTDCWIGGGAIILPGVTIGNGVTVGAGSVVTKDVKDRCVVVGNPARIIKEIE